MFMPNAITSAMVMPPRPPNAPPTNTRNTVRPTSRTIVFRLFI